MNSAQVGASNLKYWATLEAAEEAGTVVAVLVETRPSGDTSEVKQNISYGTQVSLRLGARVNTDTPLAGGVREPSGTDCE